MNKLFNKNNKNNVEFNLQSILDFLTENMIFNYQGELIQIKDNIASVVNKKEVQVLILEELKKENDPIVIQAFLKQSKNMFSNDHYFIYLMDCPFEEFKQSKNFSTHFFKNKIIQVYKDSYKEISYKDFDNGFIWNSAIVDIDFYFDSEEPVIQQFLYNVSQTDLPHFERAIGYLNHNFYDGSKRKCIVLNDSNLNEFAEGGTGKGIIQLIIKNSTKTKIFDGKNWSPDNSFAYQTVSIDDNVIVIDDIKKGFKFEGLYSSITTTDFSVERKNQTPITVPQHQIPKFVISTNYALNTPNNSDKRRVNELTLNSHYGLEREPMDDFNHRFFDDWSKEEWVRFHNYILKCVREYLINGLTKQENKALAFKKLQNETNITFVEVMNEVFNTFNKRYKLSEVEYEMLSSVGYRSKTGQIISDNRVISKWIEIYCRYYGYHMEKGRDGFGTWFIISEEV